MTSHVWRRSLCSTETWNFLRDQVSFWCFVTYLPVSLHWHSKLLHSDMLLIYGFTNDRPWTSATQNKCDFITYIYIDYYIDDIMYRLGWFHQQSLDLVEHRSLNISSIQPLLEGLMAASGVLGEQLRRVRGKSGELRSRLWEFLWMMKIQLNPYFLSFKKTISLLNECPLKMWLH